MPSNRRCAVKDIDISYAYLSRSGHLVRLEPDQCHGSTFCSVRIHVRINRFALGGIYISTRPIIRTKKNRGSHPIIDIPETITRHQICPGTPAFHQIFNFEIQFVFREALGNHGSSPQMPKTGRSSAIYSRPLSGNITSESGDGPDTGGGPEGIVPPGEQPTGMPEVVNAEMVAS